jgi:hypothetical protein
MEMKEMESTHYSGLLKAHGRNQSPLPPPPVGTHCEWAGEISSEPVQKKTRFIRAKKNMAVDCRRIKLTVSND